MMWKKSEQRPVPSSQQTWGTRQGTGVRGWKSHSAVIRWLKMAAPHILKSLP